MKKKTKKIMIITASVILGIILLLVSTFFIMRYIGKRKFHKNDTNIKTDSVIIDDENLILYKDSKYKLNENIVSILIMGVDKEDITENEGYGANGQADCIFLAVIDTEKKKFTMIPISREAMVDVDTYSVSGNRGKVLKTQLCLAYAYGGNPQESCENVMKSVKRMFYGLNINSYVAIDLNGLSKLSTLVGGVDVTSLETFGDSENSFKEGETYTLTGKKANSYIRARGSDIEANNRRMLRQKQFLSALISKTGNHIMDDFSNLARFYNTMQPYTSTNIDLTQATYLASSCLTRDVGSRIEYKSIKGTMTESEHSEFNIDEESLLQIIIDTFYIKVKE